MTGSESPIPATPARISTHNNDITGTPAESVRVIVPREPPEFGPAAARALLRLLVAIHAKRTAIPAEEEP